MRNNKQLATNLIANIISFGVSFGISFFLSPYIISNVGKEAHGFVSLANDFVNYIALFTIALNSMASRFITIKIHKNELEDASYYFNSLFVGNIFISVLLIVPSILGIIYLDSFLNIKASIVTDVKILFALSFTTFLVSLISSTFSVAPFVKNRIDLASIRDIEANIVKVFVILILFYFFDVHVFFVGIAGLAYTLVQLKKNISYTKKLLPELKISIGYFKIKYVFEMISAGAWNVLSKISSILSSELSLLISNLAIGDSAMGIIAVAKTFPNVLLQLMGVLASVFAPEFTISYAKNDYDLLNKQIQSSMKIMGMIIGIPMTLLIGLGPFLFRLWVPSIDTKILYMMALLYGFGFIFAGPVEPLYNVFVATNNIKIPSIYALITGILNILMVILGLKFVENDLLKMVIILGCTTLFTVIRTTIFIPIYAAYCLEFKKTVFYPQIIKSVVSVSIMSGILLFIQEKMAVTTWLQLILASGIVSVAQFSLNFFLFFRRDERKAIIKKVGNFLVSSK